MEENLDCYDDSNFNSEMDLLEEHSWLVYPIIQINF